MHDSPEKKFARRLRDAVENREEVELSSVDVEVASSETSARLWRRYALVESALEAGREERVEVDLAEAVLAKLRSEPGCAETAPPRPTPDGGRASTPSREGRRARIAVLTTAVAAALVGVVLVLNGGPRPGTEKSDDQRPVAEVDAPPPEPSADVEELLSEASAAAQELASEARSAVAELALLVPVDSNDGPSAPTSEGFGTWFDEIESDTNPVQRGVDRALDFLLGPEVEESANT